MVLYFIFANAQDVLTLGLNFCKKVVVAIDNLLFRFVIQLDELLGDYGANVDTRGLNESDDSFHDVAYVHHVGLDVCLQTLVAQNVDDHVSECFLDRDGDVVPGLWMDVRQVLLRLGGFLLHLLVRSRCVPILHIKQVPFDFVEG